jgi:4-hydroxybenzoate polyprenyltransferase
VGNGPKRLESESSSPQLFDGVHMAGWVDLLPSSWKPYIQLARLSPPVPVLLIYFPHLFGVAHAAVVHDAPLSQILRVSGILLGGSIFLSNTIHGWNDLIDAPIDAQIVRTRNRPIPRGAITPRAAFLFTVSQALIALCFFFLLPAGTIWFSIPSVLANYYYPYAKRHTSIPQVVLGVALQWAVVVGHASMGGSGAWTDPSVLCLFFAALLWTVVYDTVYGFQDYDQDVKLGVGSTAVLFGRSSGRPILWLLSNSVVAFLFAAGYFADMTWAYYAVAAGGSFASLNAMVASVDLSSPDNCAWWFVYGFWGPGLSISLGLLIENALK